MYSERWVVHLATAVVRRIDDLYSFFDHASSLLRCSLSSSLCSPGPSSNAKNRKSPTKCHPSKKRDPGIQTSIFKAVLVVQDRGYCLAIGNIPAIAIFFPPAVALRVLPVVPPASGAIVLQNCGQPALALHRRVSLCILRRRGARSGWFGHGFSR